MSRTHVKTYAFKCDFCGKKVSGTELPKGWHTMQITMHDCGLTGYSTTEDFDSCEECYPKEKHQADLPGARQY